LNKIANSSTTNAPSNVVRSCPISVRVAMSAATTPRKASGIVSHFRFADRKASATKTSSRVPDRISSGRIAV